MANAGAVAGAGACTAALCVGGLLGPTGASAMLALLPLPGLALAGTYGAATMVACTAVTAVAIGVLLGSEAACLYVAVAVAPLIAMVWALERGLRIETVIGLAVAVLIVGVSGSLLASYGSLTLLQAAVSEAWKKSFDGALSLYRTLGVPEEELFDLELRRSEIERGLRSLLPALIAAACGALWFLNLRLASRWASWPQTKELRHWQAPPWMIWTLIAAGFGMFFPQPAVEVLARNVFVVALVGFFCQGLAIVSYYLQRLKLPLGLRAASYLLIGLQEIVAGIVLALGVFDLWGNFRRLGVPQTDTDSE